MNKISSPYLLIDSNKVRENLEGMVLKAKESNSELRPHFKTHQSKIIGSWFKESGVKAISVSSLKMAEYFAEDGWNDITIAFPVNILEAERLNTLAGKISLHVLAIDSDTLSALNSRITSSIGIYIELDPGYGRSGVPMSEFSRLNELLETINVSENLSSSGFYSHAGHTYKCRGKDEIVQLTKQIFDDLQKIKEEFGLPICYGDTPSCSVLTDFKKIDQMSPGNFIFYDWMQTQIGSCSEDQIAVIMQCPVVAKYPERNEILVHGGAVHFSKEMLIKPDGTPYFGIVSSEHQDWTKRPFLKSISQEHGIIAADDAFFNATKVGDILSIYPNHSCLTANLMGTYFDENGNQFDHL